MIQLFLLYLGQLIALLLVALAWQLLQAPLVRRSSKPSGSESDVLTYESFLTAAKKLQEMSSYDDWEQGQNLYSYTIPEAIATPPTTLPGVMEDYSRRNLPDTLRTAHMHLYPAQHEAYESYTNVPWSEVVGQTMGRAIDRAIMDGVYETQEE